jgi:hypothetical protein
MRKINRRQLLVRIGVAGLCGPAILRSIGAAQAAVATPRMSLDKFMQDRAKVEAFRRGVGVMKARKPSDPTSWFFQAAMHGVRPDWVDGPGSRRRRGRPEVLEPVHAF